MVYVGSKNRLSKELAPIIQSYITEDTKGYLEPFVGGANMIDKIQHPNRIGSDIHKELIALLNKAKDDVDNIPNTITRDEYYRVKDNKANYEDWYVGLVGFCASYNAKYFGGYTNSSKPKTGRVRNYMDEYIKNLKKQAPNLNGIKFINKSFLDLPKDEIKGYVIYCDIPYKGATKYTTRDFPYEEFYKWANEMAENNTVLISEYDMPSGFKCIWEKDWATLMNRNKKEDGKRVERLFICEPKKDDIK